LPPPEPAVLLLPFEREVIAITVFSELLSTLNPAQRSAVELTEGPLVVIAGAGSGKTRVLTHRIAYLVHTGLSSPHAILALTFTQKAAREMRDRLGALLGERAEQLMLGTFHALALRIVKTEGQKLGYDISRLRVFDAAHARAALHQAMRQARLDERRWDAAQIADVIARAKQQLRSPDAFVRVSGDVYETTVGRLYTFYQQILKQANAVDFDDLLMLAAQLLRDDADVRDFYSTIYRYVLVDEFQDVSELQYLLMRRIAERHENICVVSSPAQAIYGWRGVNAPAILNRFERDFPTAEVIVLDQNYRSTQTIIAAANAILNEPSAVPGSRNAGQALSEREKPLWTRNIAGASIALKTASTEADEAKHVTTEIVNLIQADGFQAEQCMVLFRTHRLARPLEQALLHAGLPYTLEGDNSFFNRKEVKDMLAYLSLAHNPDNALELERVINVPPRGLGAKALEAIKAGEPQLSLTLLLNALADENLKPTIREALQGFHDLVLGTLYEAGGSLPLGNLFDLTLEATGYQLWLAEQAGDAQRLANLNELRRLALRQPEVDDPRRALGDFLNEIALLAESDPLYLDHGGVRLITIHTAKGLEARAVFLIGLEEGVFPHQRALGTQAELNEERRVFYVGLTRAMERLYLSYARTRSGPDGHLHDHAPSRFVREIPRNLIEHLT
jgi:DNA helicase II / ATP-dependent DNA helicase PcrA